MYKKLFRVILRKENPQDLVNGGEGKELVKDNVWISSLMRHDGS